MSKKPRSSKPIGGNTRYRFEQWVQNPDCEANVKSAVFDIRMSGIAEKDLKREMPGPSPFALAFGITFEDALFKNNAERFREELLHHKLIPNENIEFMDFRTKRNRGPLADTENARQKTEEFFNTLPRKVDGEKYYLIAGATISVPGRSMLPEAILILDAIFVKASVVKGSEQCWELKVGEIKTYPDRGGFTDKTQLGTARAQAGVYAYGLRVTLEKLGLGKKIRVSQFGFLVFSKPGANFPSIRPNEELTFQIERAARGFERLREVASESLPEGRADEAVQEADVAYTENCFTFCPRAAHCYKVELERGNPVVLGQDVARFTSGINLARVVDLISGKSKPENLTESEFVERFQDAEGRSKLGR